MNLTYDQRWTFHKLGLGPRKAVTKIGPVDTLANITKTLGHRHIDILKVDVEGSEWGSLERWTRGLETSFSVHQLLIELHIVMSEKIGAASFMHFVQQLEMLGLYTFNTEPNPINCPYTGRWGALLCKLDMANA